MIYVQIQTQAQSLFIPRSIEPSGGPEGLTLRLRRGGHEKTFTGLSYWDVNTRYYIIEIEDASMLTTGEYDYTLTGSEGIELSSGILTAGEYVREIKDVPGGNKVIEYGN